MRKTDPFLRIFYHKMWLSKFLYLTFLSFNKPEMWPQRISQSLHVISPTRLFVFATRLYWYYFQIRFCQSTIWSSMAPHGLSASQKLFNVIRVSAILHFFLLSRLKFYSWTTGFPKYVLLPGPRRRRIFLWTWYVPIMCWYSSFWVYFELVY